MKLTNDELKNESINEIIERCEIITIAANRLTELRLANKFTLLELEGEIDNAVAYALETKGASYADDLLTFMEIKEYFYTLIDKFSGRCKDGFGDN